MSTPFPDRARESTFRVRDGCGEQFSSGDSQPCPPTGETTAGDAVVDDVLRTLSSIEARQAADVTIVGAESKKPQASPWLERTRWPRHLAGIRLHDDAAGLARLPDQGERILDTLSASVDRLIEQVYVSLCEDKINIFAQRCIRFFLPHRKAYSQPSMVKQQKATYSTYKDLWKRLLCFVCRTSDLRQSTPLRYTLTSRQTAALDALLSSAERIKHANHLNPSPSSTADDKVHQQLDSLCLAFCIALLDHQLKGDLFDSVVLNCLAVISIDRNNATFHEAASYTLKLSGFVKISQMLVLQQAVHEAEERVSENALDPLNEMRERFMTIYCCTPFSWAVSLRSYGKKIRDSTTSIGYIQRSDDESTLYYKNIELQISAFRTMVANQVTRAQRLLKSLFLLSIDETRENIVPAVQLYRLRDNPTVITNGWNFLQYERNQDSLPSKKRWLLQRVLQSDELRGDFVSRDRFDRVVWQKAAVKQYLKQVDTFLEALLLLVHLTAGQSARGTEIIGLLHKNTALHRNIFIEDGLVSVVTSYHKGYTCTGATKIIHRYLPKEVSELYVYYVWIIYPFVHELSLLSPYGQRWGSSFLWPDEEGSWNPGRLSAVLKRETESALKAPMTIVIYRYVAIALSRRHLRCGGFKRDYDLTDAASDVQTTHRSWTAGMLHARRLEEAPGPCRGATSWLSSSKSRVARLPRLRRRVRAAKATSRRKSELSESETATDAPSKYWSTRVVGIERFELDLVNNDEIIPYV